MSSPFDPGGMMRRQQEQMRKQQEQMRKQQEQLQQQMKQQQEALRRQQEAAYHYAQQKKKEEEARQQQQIHSAIDQAKMQGRTTGQSGFIQQDYAPVTQPQKKGLSCWGAFVWMLVIGFSLYLCMMVYLNQ